MKRNKLREALKAGRPTVGTHIQSSWPSVVEIIGHTGVFDYIEFVAEYAPFDLFSLENLCRAAELVGLSTMIKLDQEPRRFLAQRSIGAGFDSVLFADCRTPDDVRECVRAVKPETPAAGGYHGVGVRRSSYVHGSGQPDYAQQLDDVVIAFMIEKRSAVDALDEILALGGVDMIQWGPADYALSIGRPGEFHAPDVRETERRVIATCLAAGVPPRAEIESVDRAKYYLDLGVRHFCLGTDIMILYQFLRDQGEKLQDELGETLGEPPPGS
jgi:2-keto-3-deoxy-L-rhamnonate aldolase RhmA